SPPPRRPPRSEWRMTKKPKDVTSLLGGPAVLEVEVSHLNVPSVWKRNGSDLEISEKFRISSSGKSHSLRIMNASQEDSGEYTFTCGSDAVSARVNIKQPNPNPDCSPSEPNPDSSSSDPNPSPHSLTLTLTPPPPADPSLTQFVNPLSLGAEGTATFIAKLGGDPIPSVKWMKGKWRQVTHGGRVSVEQKGPDARLEIREVTRSDAGQYRCVATNKHGEIETILETSGPRSESHDPKDYERILREHEIYDYRAILTRPWVWEAPPRSTARSP
uniref:Ig-like domain-containing protein n=1 Tax=Neogobius melanostomus TaxID=47308 RepID=A0A8C6V0L4_9GOBI